MWRVLLTTWIAYGCGHPALDGYRPPGIDRPLQLFHEHVNAAAQDGKKGIAAIGESSVMRYLKGYVARVDAQLRPDSR